METDPQEATAGGATQRRTHRQGAARERAVSQSAHSGRLLRALSDDPSTINGFGHGGERTRDLATLLTDSIRDGAFLSQRRLGLRSTEDSIDLIAVVPSGVWVVDIQPCAGGRVEVSGRMEMLSSHYSHLLIRGRDRTTYLDRLTGQSRVVEEALAELDRPDIPVLPTFCFFDADIRWRRSPHVGRALLTTPRRLSTLLRRSPRTMSDVEVSAMAQALGQRLPRQQLRH